MNDNRRNKGGFSIVELLIALVIISILTSLSVVLVARRAEKARRTAALHDMTEIRNGLDHAALDTGYYYRLYVLDDVRGGDGIGYGSAGDRIDGILDEPSNNVASTNEQIFIQVKTGAQLNSSTATTLFTQLFNNETKFGWEGAYIAFQRKHEVTGMPLDPWGNPYLLFSGVGFMDELTGLMIAGNNRSFNLIFRGESASRGQMTPSKFDRMTLVSLGPDGMVGDGGLTDIGQGDDLMLSW